ncbi:MAG: M55 family metallopeptidase [Clostridia bacterium]
MKYYIHTDLEGISGFVDLDEVNMKESRGLLYTKEILTGEVNAVVQGIRHADKEAEIVVQDGHGGGWWGPNILVEKLDPSVTLIQGKRGTEIAGLDESFAMLMHIGAHAMAGTQFAVMSHTVSLGGIHNVWINERKMGEVGIVASIAGHYGVPVGLVAGDYWAVLEAQTLLGDIEGVSVKKGINHNTATCLSPEVTKKMLAAAAQKAIKRINDFQPLSTEGGVEFKIEYNKTSDADQAERRGGKRLDGRTVMFKGENITKVVDYL